MVEETIRIITGNKISLVKTSKCSGTSKEINHVGNLWYCIVLHCYV